MQRPNIKTPKDISSLKGYVDTVDPETIPLSHILYPYDIRPFKIKCALCGQEHMDGRIVALVDKSITNIGHVCGKKFGGKYAEALTQYHESLEKPILTQKITEGLSKIDSLQLTLLALRNRSGDLKEREFRFASLFADTYRDLRRRAFDNKADIYESVERTKDEIDDLLAANPYQTRDSLRIKEEYRGAIHGHKFPSTDWSADHGVFRIVAEANRFAELSGRSLSMQVMARWANWLDDFDHNLGFAKAAVEEGDRFFTEQNFKLFALLPAAPAGQARLRSLTLLELDARPKTPTPLQTTTAQSLGKIRAKRPEPELTSRQLRRLLGDKKTWR
jgi:hypothetical protein